MLGLYLGLLQLCHWHSDAVAEWLQRLIANDEADEALLNTAQIKTFKIQKFPSLIKK
jgi:hypothetical protein